jgi:hypothetical protein
VEGLKVNWHLGAAHDPVVALLLVVFTVAVWVWIFTRRYR